MKQSTKEALVYAGIGLIIIALAGVFWVALYLGGSHPRILTSIDTRGNLVSGFSCLGMLGIALIVASTWPDKGLRLVWVGALIYVVAIVAAMMAAAYWLLPLLF